MADNKKQISYRTLFIGLGIGTIIGVTLGYFLSTLHRNYVRVVDIFYLIPSKLDKLLDSSNTIAYALYHRDECISKPDNFTLKSYI